ncbi:hypothetical protein BpHYR1_009895 [Brachionus plicatilis]|uniref:Uncharacterized protein n=1 Tax=Brachionus plicatilis TaxID=10195 RepID=A0A3M7QKA2_BRAPC|nr:hypothetical protein BpHYR1_009895 [Brachionus plicatilis]
MPTKKYICKNKIQQKDRTNYITFLSMKIENKIDKKAPSVYSPKPIVCITMISKIRVFGQ